LLPSSVCANGIALPAEVNWRTKMIAISSTAAQPAAPGVLGGFIRWIGIRANGLATYLERRAAIKALQKLDDRGLRDIGLARCHIEAAVCGRANPELGRLR
jgi:uncharacterized protein YjiS (DUF1127 family)